MNATVEIAIETPEWRSAGIAELAERAASAVFCHLNLPDRPGVSLLATDDARIAILNAGFRGRNAATNVLSWPAEDLSAEEPGGRPALPQADFPGEPPFLGDIALAWETCLREAETAGKPFGDHVVHLIVHGLLHLLGYDHERDEDAALMEGIEIEVLGKLGLPDPY
ncbi:rRNA maturation RNase YbeY [Tropicimonas sp.]|uniref:rRNA maturation RNase YbeY n=1 Tax=Tropicimonas sp. TaxID=2067044 RepID=UPI003A875234